MRFATGLRKGRRMTSTPSLLKTSSKAALTFEFSERKRVAIWPSCRLPGHIPCVLHNSRAGEISGHPAIHSYFQFAAYCHPEHATLMQRVLAIPPSALTGPSSLSQPVDALLASPHRTTGDRSPRPRTSAVGALGFLEPLARASSFFCKGPRRFCKGPTRAS